MTTDENQDLFDELLATGTVRREKVDIYFDQAAVATLEALEAEIAALDPDAPETINETSRVADIARRWDEAKASYDASRATFTLVPVDTDDQKAVWERFPNPPAPENPAKARWPLAQNDADAKRIAKQRETAEAEYQAKRKVWALEVDRLEAERIAALLSLSIESIESVKGSKSGMSAEQVKALRAAKYGSARVGDLWEGYKKVHQSTGEIDRPTLPGDSGSDRA